MVRNILRQPQLPGPRIHVRICEIVISAKHVFNLRTTHESAICKCFRMAKGDNLYTTGIKKKIMSHTSKSIKCCG